MTDSFLTDSQVEELREFDYYDYEWEQLLESDVSDWDYVNETYSDSEND